MLTPLLVVALAYGLWWISDRLLDIGPLDRATFGWLVVVPVWALAPYAAAHAWRALNPGQLAVAAGVVGLILTVASAGLFWAANAFPNCDFGAVRAPAEWIVPSAVVGIVIGGGFTAVCFASTSALRRGRHVMALAVGAGSAFALVFVAILVATPFMTGGCQRPF